MLPVKFFSVQTSSPFPFIPNRVPLHSIPEVPSVFALDFVLPLPLNLVVSNITYCHYLLLGLNKAKDFKELRTPGHLGISFQWNGEEDAAVFGTRLLKGLWRQNLAHGIGSGSWKAAELT